MFVSIVTGSKMTESTVLSQARLLVVDDDPGIRDLLSRYLGRQGYQVSAVGDGTEMDAWLAEHTPDLVILDLMLPGEDGLSLARRLRADGDLPVVMLSARGDEVDRIVGLEVGADDYLAKPFNPRELLARVRAVLRRRAPSDREDGGFEVDDTDREGDDVVMFGPYRLDFATRMLSRDSEVIALSRAEFELLEVLVRHPRRTLSRDFIMEALGGQDRDAFDRSIDVRVTRLRRKIEPQPSQPVYIRTVWGVGYLFEPQGDQAVTQR
jgi:DNA-binding response OmpR family regulator